MEPIARLLYMKKINLLLFFGDRATIPRSSASRAVTILTTLHQLPTKGEENYVCSRILNGDFYLLLFLCLLLNT